MADSSKHVVVVAGESSGDAHAADFVSALRATRPETTFSGMGSSNMQKAGVHLVIDSTKLAVMGLVEVLLRYRELRRALNQMKRHLAQSKPDLLVLVDYVEFNLRLARYAKRLGIKVLFYVSPQVWAWRPGRITKIGQAIDAMAVLFPFEADLYRQHNIPVRYVGNPLIDQVVTPRPAAELRGEFGLEAGRPVVGLLPGSRVSETHRHLPVMVKACQELAARMPELQFALAVANSIDADRDIRPFIPPNAPIKLIFGRSHDVMAASDALMIASGTATLEAGLIAVPMAIIYRMSPITHAVLRHLVSIENIGLVNIVAGERVVQEYIQNAATPEAIACEIEKLLTDPEYAERVRAKLRQIKEKLGEGGVSKRVAQMANELLDVGRISSS